jgi:hypothetical protein
VTRLRPTNARSSAVVFLAVGAAACAGRYTVPDPAAVAAAVAAPSYSARLRIALAGPELRARTPVLLAFQRPDALRIEVPGPAGARLIAVASGGRLWAVFPSERAFFTGEANASDFEALLGVALVPREVMDLLVGVPSPRMRSYQARWRGGLPARVDVTLPDGGRLTVHVEEADTAAALAPAAFAEPPHEGFRAVTADEARRLSSGR